jgi:hypothetical protein
MNTAIITAFSVSGWLSAVSHTLVHCFNTMNMTQWGIVAASAVAFGFLCLKGTAIDR